MRETWHTEVTLLPFAWSIGRDVDRHWYKCYWIGPVFIERWTGGRP